MKTLTKLLALCLAAALLALSLAACGGSNASSAPSSSEASTAQSSEDLGEPTESTGEVSQGEDTSVPADYSNPDVTIAYGDFDGIVTFTDAMLAGQYDGQIIQVEGISSKRMSNCAILEANEAGDEKRGFTWQLEGAPEMSAYPADDTHVVITGQVVIGEYDVRFLQVPADQVKVVEE